VSETPIALARKYIYLELEGRRKNQVKVHFSLNSIALSNKLII